MKKTRLTVSLLLALMMVFTVALAACNTHEHTFDTKWSSNNTYHWHKATCEHTSEVKDRATHTLDNNGVCTVCGRDSSLNSYRAYITADLRDVKNAIGTLSDAKVAANVAAAYDAGCEAIQSGNSVTAIQTAFKNAKEAMVRCIPLANGVFDYTGLSTAERTKILGLLESYAIRNGMAGISFIENGRYVMYNDRVVLGTENHIPGYGFGLLTEGHFTAPLEAEQNADWKMYYHTLIGEDPGTMNYLDAQGADVSDVYSYIGASYYTTFMNSTKDGYEWVPELAAADPTPVGELNAAGQTTTWEFPIREGLKYSTLGSRTDYNNREVAPEDFITPFKLLLNQANDYYRGSSLANATGVSAIPGAKAYYNATAGAAKGILSDSVQSFEGVGVKVYQKDGDSRWWFQYTLGAPVNAWYARYYISSSLYMPIPADFINEVGVDNYLGFSSDASSKPVDNSLSLGAFTLERWDEDQQIVYKKNPNYVYADTKYNVAGVHINIFPASQTDENAAFREFLDGKIDGSGIPRAYLAEYASQPGVRTTTGSQMLQFNMNSLDAETWEKLFGENGSIAQNAPSDYWQVEPALSNAHFRSALSYAFNRPEFAADWGMVPSVNFFSSVYQSDPENGVAYNLTQEHQNAVAGLLLDTDHGYSLQLARDYFKMAIDELEAAGLYTRGTPSNPTKINIEVKLMVQSEIESTFAPMKQYWEEAFNDDSVTYGGCYQLEVTSWVGPNMMDVYDYINTARFDIAEGGISGSSDDPLGFMGVLSTDQIISQGFTLNWSVDTNDPYADVLVYDGKLWSFDALYQATQELSSIKDGKYGALVTAEDGDSDIGEETATVEIVVSWADGVEIAWDEVGFVVFGYKGGKYDEWDITDTLVGEPVIDNANRKATFTLSIAIDSLGFDAGSRQGIDLYMGWTVDGSTVETDYFSTILYDFCPAAEAPEASEAPAE